VIDTANIQVAITMTDDDFIGIAKQGEAGPAVSVVEVGNGWAIYGPSGVYKDSSGQRIFDLAKVHSFIAGWGIKRFVQGKVVLAMP